jgi:hypothetical protein
MAKHPEYGDIPGNQEPNTPDVNESEQRRGRSHGGQESHGHGGHESHSHGGHESHSRDHGGHEGSRQKHPEYGKIPGNQEPNTPDVNESEQRRKH